MKSRLLSWLRTVPARLTGSRVDVQAEHVTRLSCTARFDADADLERKIKAAREALGDVEPKGLRLIEEQPDVISHHRWPDDLPIG